MGHVFQTHLPGRAKTTHLHNQLAAGKMAMRGGIDGGDGGSSGGSGGGSTVVVLVMGYVVKFV